MYIYIYLYTHCWIGSVNLDMWCQMLTFCNPTLFTITVSSISHINLSDATGAHYIEFYHSYPSVCLCFRYESKGKQFAKNQPQYPVGLSPEIINAAKAKKEKADRVASKSNPIPGLVIVSTLEGTEVCYFCSALGRALLLYINFGKGIL